MIEGLDFEGLGTGLSGVSVQAATLVHIINCEIRDFTVAGIDVSPIATSSANQPYVLVTDTLLDNNLIGVRYKSSGARQEARGALDHVTILGNSTVAG